MHHAAAREVTWVNQPVADAERRVLDRIAHGDRNALAELYARHQAVLFRYLVQLTGDHGLAEEVLQDTLVAVWRSAASFEGRSTVQTWLIGIARRQAHNNLRRRTLPLADVAELEVVPANEPDPQDAVLASAEREELAAAIKCLAPVHREALTLAFVNGLSYREMATVLGIPEGTVKSRLSNAKRALRTLLEAAEGVGP
ncbi:MAG TPA: RNA polymerase sigma factor [Chloroflexota bacterium]|nr:RNA polymerase sigma factor [Chloroflexota bacterium]